MPSRRQQILAVLIDRVEAIDGTGEFETTAGNSVHLGEAPAFGPDDPLAAIVLVVGDDRVRYVGGAKFIELPIEIQALANAASDADWATAGFKGPYVLIEALLGDLKRAIEVADRSLGGLIAENAMEPGPTRTLPREPGQTVVGVALTYTVTYKEAWGAP